jgi:23S rRNA pseudouridine955/2504/2580 synthase
MSGVQILSVAEGEGDQRLDRWLRRHFPHISQGRIEKMCRKGEIRVDGGRVKAATRLSEGQEVRIPPLPSSDARPAPAPTKVSEADARMIRACVIYRDDHILALNKPHGLAVQGGSGQTRHVDALNDALRFDLEERPRLVHRLDKDTSGLLVVAKDDRAHKALSAQFAAHGRDGRLQRRYLALVWGEPWPRRGSIDTHIGRSSNNRLKMAVLKPGCGGRHAITHYETLQVFDSPDGGKPLASLVACELETGRTHQIRVHMAHIGHPLLGDTAYGASHAASANRLPSGAREALRRPERRARPSAACPSPFRA